MSIPHAAADGNLPEVYRATVQQAVARAGVLMGKLVAAARQILQAREVASRDLRERDKLAESARLLRQWEAALCKRYPQTLLETFAHPPVTKKAGIAALVNLEFDQLELMDEAQVLSSVTLARIQQVAMQAADHALADLNTLICRTLGLETVQPERNPLRPDVYIKALKEVVEHTHVAVPTQMDWLGAMGVALGQELRNLYVDLAAQLRGRGVVSVGYAMAPGQGVRSGARFSAPHAGPDSWDTVSPGLMAQHSAATRQQSAPGGVASAQWRQAEPLAADPALLTLDKLRQLLAGTLQPAPQTARVQQFADRFAQEFESDPQRQEAFASDFDSTVPAALEALTEMRQVDQMVQRLESRRDRPALVDTASDASVEAVRGLLRARASGIAQALSLEVITLMVDNIARDLRLLEPVQALIRQLEAPLLRLALVDRRMFGNKQHPARLLIQEIAQRSLAYALVQSPGFGEFMHLVERAVAPLLDVEIDNAEPFERALQTLQDQWRQQDSKEEVQRQEAVTVLRHAEDRNLLAEKIAREIDGHPEAIGVPEVVMNFLCGPWSQVLARARMAESHTLVEKYQSLVAAMLWSTQPTLTHKDYAKLTRLVPMLLATLREGLDTIQYPATRTSAFMEALMGVHQKAFRAAQKGVAADAIAPVKPQELQIARQLATEEPWVGPDEARASCFLALPEGLPPSAVAPTDNTAGPLSASASRPDQQISQFSVTQLPLGSWLEMLVDERWLRTQLIWASPHGTLFLFTNVFGSSQSMSRRSVDKLVATGRLRVIASQPVVDGALNAVAHLAMQNSIHTSL
ncbi:MAG: DUF1631 domain-containing protein [Rhodoferax sp.]|nr:DUF1631 domain-containing protein [Rhodoferax sp.]